MDENIHTYFMFYYVYVTIKTFNTHKINVNVPSLFICLFNQKKKKKLFYSSIWKIVTSGFNFLVF